MTGSGPERLRAELDRLGLVLEVRELSDSTRTAAEAAAALGCSVGEIAKSLVFRTASDRAVVAVMSGSNRLHVDKLAALVEEQLGKADAGFVRSSTGYAIGGVPPFGYSGELATFLDEDLFAYDVVWAAAGSPFAVFAIGPDQLEAATGAPRADLKE